MTWTLHFLRGEGGLEPWRDRLSAECEAVYGRVADLLAPDVVVPQVDLIIQRVRGRTIPELGLVGHAWRRSCVVLSLDPDNEAFEASLAAGQFGRMLAHEVHHCLRIERLGFSSDLASALVSEGLADHFERELNGGDGQMWTRAVPAHRWPDLIPLAEDRFRARRYDHDLWFYGPEEGQISLIPRWAGYSLGYRLVGIFLDVESGQRASRMAGTTADYVMRIAWPRFCAEHGVQPSQWV